MMNPYAAAFSQLMNQLHPNNQQNNQNQQSNHHHQHIQPTYNVYIPGAVAPNTLHGYSTSPVYPTPPPPSSPYPYTYTTHNYPYPASIHTQYAASAASVYAAPPALYPPMAAYPSVYGNNKVKQQNQQHQQKRYNQYQQQNNAVPKALPSTPAANTSISSTSVTSPNLNVVNKSFSFAEASAAPSVYYCEACEKDFPNQSTYNSHCSTHEQCSYPGCVFIASKRVVQAHFHGTHGLYAGQGFKDIEVEGQSFRVLLGTSPEEVAQWRLERRKKFPSTANASVINTSESSGNTVNQLSGDTGSPGQNNRSGNKKSLAAQRREEWKLKKQQQRLERQHYKQLRDAHHSQQDEHDDNDRNDETLRRNFIQIQSSQSNIEGKGIEVISTIGESDPNAISSIRLRPADEISSNLQDQQPPIKRARFENKVIQRKEKNASNKQKHNGGSILRKPDISGNLLAKLLTKEIRAEENLLLQSIRYLRQLYDPNCRQVDHSPIQVNHDGSLAKPVSLAAEEDSCIAQISEEEKRKMIEQLSTMDIDLLLAEAQAETEDVEMEDGEIVEHDGYGIEDEEGEDLEVVDPGVMEDTEERHSDDLEDI